MIHGHCDEIQTEKKNANDPRAFVRRDTYVDFFNSRRPKTLSSVSLIVVGSRLAHLNHSAFGVTT